MKVFINIFNAFLVVLAFIGFLFGICWVYFLTLGTDKLPKRVVSSYTGTVHDNITGKDKPSIEINYFEKKDAGPGLEVVEIRFNCYSDMKFSTIYSRGVQYVKEINDKNKEKWNLYYYDTDYSGVSHEALYPLEAADEKGQGATSMIFDINGDPYFVELSGQYKERVFKQYSSGKQVGKALQGFFTFHWPSTFHTHSSRYGEYVVETRYYTIEQFMESIRLMVGGISSGYGDCLLPMSDFGSYLNVYDMNNNGLAVGGGEFKNGNVTRNNYFMVQTHCDRRGLTAAKQSLFGSVKYDFNYNETGIDSNVQYHKDTTIINMTQNDFIPTYSTLYDGYYYALDPKKISAYKNFEDLEINIVFDISKLEKKCLGFDYYSLYGLEINSLKIISSVEQDFVLLPNSLKDTGIKISDIQTENINLINNNSGVL